MSKCNVAFDTTSADHEATGKLLQSYIGDFLQYQPGFIESWLQERVDETGFLHFARWRQEADFRAFAALAQTHPDLPALRALKPVPGFYRPVTRFNGRR